LKRYPATAVNRVPAKKTAECREIWPISLQNRASWLVEDGDFDVAMAVLGMFKLFLFALADESFVQIISNRSSVPVGTRQQSS